MEQDSISLRQSSTKYILLHGTANKIPTTRISYYRDNQAQLESTVWTKSKILIQSDPIFLSLFFLRKKGFILKQSTVPPTLQLAP
jgi:hypothetical protein